MLYTFRSARTIIGGQGALRHLSEYMPNPDRTKRVLIIASEVIDQQGHTHSIRKTLQAKGISVDILSGKVEREPTLEDLENIHASTRHEAYDTMIGIGGGSVLDVVKVLAVMRTNTFSLRDVLGVDKISNPGVSTILIPTTSGTGSEVTPNAIVTIPEDEMKIGIVSDYLLPQLAVLDPELTVSLPPSVTATTGMDAFTHAFESFISNKANPISDVYALEGIRRISRSLMDAYENGSNLQAREDMLLGSMYGGMALTSAGTAAVHALAYPLGGSFGVPHGVANAMLLPYVTEFQQDELLPRMPQCAEAMGLYKENGSNRKLTDSVIDQLHKWAKAMKIPNRLADFGIEPDDIQTLSESAYQVKRLLNNNPRELTIPDIVQIYEKLL